MNEFDQSPESSNPRGNSEEQRGHELSKVSGPKSDQGAESDKQLASVQFRSGVIVGLEELKEELQSLASSADVDQYLTLYTRFEVQLLEYMKSLIDQFVLEEPKELSDEQSDSIARRIDNSMRAAAIRVYRTGGEELTEESTSKRVREVFQEFLVTHIQGKALEMAREDLAPLLDSAPSVSESYLEDLLREKFDTHTAVPLKLTPHLYPADIAPRGGVKLGRRSRRERGERRY